MSRMRILRICIWQLTQPELAINEQVILHGGWIQNARCKFLIPQTGCGGSTSRVCKVGALEGLVASLLFRLTSLITWRHKGTLLD